MKCEAQTSSGERCNAYAIVDGDGKCLFHSQTKKAIEFRKSPKRCKFITKSEILKKLIKDLRDLDSIKIGQVEKIKTRLRLASLILELLKGIKPGLNSEHPEDNKEQNFNLGDSIMEKMKRWKENQA